MSNQFIQGFVKGEELFSMWLSWLTVYVLSPWRLAGFTSMKKVTISKTKYLSFYKSLNLSMSMTMLWSFLLKVFWTSLIHFYLREEYPEMSGMLLSKKYLLLFEHLLSIQVLWSLWSGMVLLISFDHSNVAFFAKFFSAEKKIIKK